MFSMASLLCRAMVLLISVMFWNICARGYQKNRIGPISLMILRSAIVIRIVEYCKKFDAFW